MRSASRENVMLTIALSNVNPAHVQKALPSGLSDLISRSQWSSMEKSLLFVLRYRKKNDAKIPTSSMYRQSQNKGFIAIEISKGLVELVCRCPIPDSVMTFMTVLRTSTV